MPGLSYRGRMLGISAVVLLSACAAVPPPGIEPTVVQIPVEPPVPVPAPAEIVPHPDTYKVQAGDTLIQISLDSGQSARDIARWNGLTDPGKIVVGQVLRLVPPPEGETPPPPKPTQPTTQPATPTTTTPVIKDESLVWAWPAEGRVVAPFNQLKTKGLEIGGAAGDGVLAAADGKVIYAGADLRGYGNAIIIKHNKTYVSLYAHNRTLLVKEDDVIKRGQKIAEMGSTDASQVKLHFEVRKLGTSVDPAAYLPAR